MKNYYSELSADKDGFLLYKKDYYVVMATHPNQPVYTGNARQRKRHLARSLDGKTLCNMLVEHGEEKLNWDSPMQYVREPDHGAGETCKVCYTKANE